MHMADALLSPGVGIALWAASAATLGAASRRVRDRADDRLVPLMGMLGAFVFAAQMVNFSDPGHRLERAPRRRPAAGDPARPACGVRRRRLGADGAGAVLCRRGPAGAGRQPVQPRRAALPGGLPADLQATGRAGALATAGRLRGHRRGRRRAATRRARRGAADHAVGHLEPAAGALPDADAADPPGHRHRRGAGDRRHRAVRAPQRARVAGPRSARRPGRCRADAAVADDAGGGRAVHRRRAGLVRVDAA